MAVTDSRRRVEAERSVQGALRARRGHVLADEVARDVAVRQHVGMRFDFLDQPLLFQVGDDALARLVSVQTAIAYRPTESTAKAASVAYEM